MRRAGRADPEPRRLVHGHDRRRTADRGARQAGSGSLHVGGVPAPGDAGLRGARQRHHVQVSVPPLELRPRRPPARRTGDGAHRGLRQRRLGPARRCRSSSGWASCSSTSTPMPRRWRRRSSATRRTSTNYDLEDAVCPGTFTLENMPWNWKVMFENFNDGYHANRLHQYVQDFCPSQHVGVPGTVDRRLERDLPYLRATPTSTVASTPPTG